MADETTSPEGYDAICRRPRCGWVSYAWPTEAQADMRLLEHEIEHRTGEAAPELFLSEAHLSELGPNEVTMRYHVHDKADD